MESLLYQSVDEYTLLDEPQLKTQQVLETETSEEAIKDETEEQKKARLF